VNPQFTTGVFNQKRWPRAGDTDDCAVLADLMAVHGVAPWLRLPGVKKYRDAANRPDQPGPTPINVADSGRAIRTLYPKLGALIEVVQGVTFATFLVKLKAGHPASVSVSSGSLPPRLQFGFSADEGHRVTVFWNGTEIRLANPLARAHSRSKPITEAELKKAIDAHDLPNVHAVLMPTVEEAFGLHPLLSGVIDDAIAELDDGTDDTDATEDVPPP
jgi:hypothetical protein